MAFPARHRYWLILALTVCLFLVYSAVGERGFVRLSRMMNERDDLRARVLALDESNMKLARQVSLLRDDPVTIENLARTELGLVRDGETVYILPERTRENPE